MTEVPTEEFSLKAHESLQAEVKFGFIFFAISIFKGIFVESFLPEIFTERL